MRVTAAALAADPDRVAPQSGLRCRCCGRNAWNVPPEELWLIHGMAAWCTDPDCQAEAVNICGPIKEPV